MTTSATRWGFRVSHLLELRSALGLAVLRSLAILVLLAAWAATPSGATTTAEHVYDAASYDARERAVDRIESGDCAGCDLAQIAMASRLGSFLVRAGVATNSGRTAIGFAPGEGVSALTPGRLQHGTAHLTDAGILPAWSGKNSPQLIRNTLSPVLEYPTATFNNTLGGTRVKGFIGTVNGQTVAVQVYAEGPLAGQLATSVVPTANQMTKWGVVP
jgi:hypothetical protein